MSLSITRTPKNRGVLQDEIDQAGEIDAGRIDQRGTGCDARPGSGLFVNSGHGMLGWTLACGSARLTADMIDRKPEASEASAFALRRAA